MKGEQINTISAEEIVPPYVHVYIFAKLRTHPRSTIPPLNK